MVFSFTQRGVTKVGAVILNTGQNENLSLARSNGKFTVGDYLTALLFRMLEAHAKGSGLPAHLKCYAIDVFRSTIYTAPSSHKTLLKHIDAACRSIAMRWDTIPVDAAVEEEAESY